MPQPARRASDLMAGMDSAPPTQPVAQLPVEQHDDPPVPAAEVARRYSGPVDDIYEAAATRTVVPARRQARSVTYGLRCTPPDKDALEQWLRVVAARYNVPLSDVTAHVFAYLMDGRPDIEQRLADWLRS